jgi:hypothetical protein
MRPTARSDSTRPSLSRTSSRWPGSTLPQITKRRAAPVVVRPARRLRALRFRERAALDGVSAHADAAGLKVMARQTSAMP